MKIPFTPGNEISGARLSAAFKAAEDAVNALYAEIAHFEQNVTVYQVPDPSGYDNYSKPPIKLDPPDKELWPTVMNETRLKIAEAAQVLAEAHEVAREAACSHGIIETEGGGGK